MNRRAPSRQPAEMKHSMLMRAMGSPDGAWNPEPDGHIAGMLREEVDLSPNESKVVALVKACCIRPKAGGRTAWGRLAGKPLTEIRVGEFFGWDRGNTNRYIRRPLAYGFIRRDEAGVFGLGASVEGVFNEGEEEAKGETDVVCTHNIPEYISAQIKGLSDFDREKFVRGWVERKTAAQERLAQAVQKAREEEQKALSELCQSFGVALRTLKKVQSVHTTSAAESVHTANGTPYGVSEQSVHTALNKETEKTFRDQRTSSSEREDVRVVREELDSYGTADDDAARQLIEDCRAKEAKATVEEIVDAIRNKGSLVKRNPRAYTNPVGFLLTAVPKCFPLARQSAANADATPTSSLEAQIASLEQALAALQQMESPQAAEVQTELDKLRAQFNGHAKAQEAGRG